MNRYKIANLILLLGLLLLAKYQQLLYPWRYGEWYKVPLFKIGWYAGSVIILFSIAFGIFRIRGYKKNKTPFIAEVFFLFLVAVASGWITYDL